MRACEDEREHRAGHGTGGFAIQHQHQDRGKRAEQTERGGRTSPEGYGMEDEG